MCYYSYSYAAGTNNITLTVIFSEIFYKTYNNFISGYICEPMAYLTHAFEQADPSDPTSPFDVHFCGFNESTLIYCYNGGSCRYNRFTDFQTCYCADGFVGDDCSIREYLSRILVLILDS